MNCELFNLDDNEENTEGTDESEEKKDKGKEKAVEETFESKYKAGYMTDKFEKMFEQMAQWENERLEEEKKTYEETGTIDDENLHSKIADFRKDDEEIMKDLREKVEKARLAESPDDVGSSSNKREDTKDDDNESSSKEDNKGK